MARVRVLALVLLLLGTVAAGKVDAAPAVAAVSGSDFTDEAVVGGLHQAVDLAWLPDGRALVLTKAGEVHLVDPAQGSRTLLFTIPGVDTRGERGALGLAIDPDFATTGHVYVNHSVAPTSQLRITRFTFDPSPGLPALTTIWQNPGPLHAEFSEYHIGGALRFGPDEHLYLSIGDGGGAGAGNAQLLDRVFGKVLRIRRDGQAPPDNPFVATSGALDEIWAYGLRNPFRASWDLVSNRYVIGDVGSNDTASAYEELNLGAAGANYGWPRCQGPLGPPKIGGSCPSQPAITPPVAWYAHSPGSCTTTASPSWTNAIVAGSSVRGPGVPPELQGAHVFADFASCDVRYVTFDAAGRASAPVVLETVPDHAPVWLGQGPDGHVYYLSYGFPGQLRRLRWVGGAGDRAPSVTSASAAPTSGPPPLTVRFSGAASDPDGDAIGYLWDFGDGTTAAGASVDHTYTSAGRYTARLEVAAGGATVFSEPLTIRVGVPPVAIVTAPAHGTSFAAGDTLVFSGGGRQGNQDLPASALRWRLELVHDEHRHPIVVDAPGPTLTYQVPTTGHGYEGDTSLLATLTVTGAAGLQAEDSVEVEPEEQVVELVTEPAGQPLEVDGVVHATPHRLETLTGFVHRVVAPSSTVVAGEVYELASWTGGRPAAFDLVVPDGPLRLVASYRATGRPAEQGSEVDGALSDQVVRLYRAVFDRQPDAPGLAHWRTQRAAGMTLWGLADEFARSPEFRSRYDGATAAALVEQLYRNTLGRPGEPAGQRYWTGELERGVPLTTVLVSFSESPENIARTGTVAPYDAAEGTVRRLYRAVLGRPGEDAGVRHWSDRLRAGDDPSLVATELLTSAEFVQRYGATGDAEFVRRLYLNVLDRAPDAGGAAHWAAVLARGAPRAQVVLEFSESPEFVLKTDTLP